MKVIKDTSLGRDYQGLCCFVNFILIQILWLVWGGHPSASSRTLWLISIWATHTSCALRLVESACCPWCVQNKVYWYEQTMQCWRPVFFTNDFHRLYTYHTMHAGILWSPLAHHWWLSCCRLIKLRSVHHDEFWVGCETVCTHCMTLTHIVKEPTSSIGMHCLKL